MSLIMLTIVLLATVGLATSTQQVCVTGNNCTLECVMEGSVTIKFLTWTREALPPEELLRYRKGDQAPKKQNSALKDRIKLSPEEPGRMSTSLTITNVSKTDMGYYTCRINPDRPQPSRQKRAASDKHSFTVELVVNAPDKAEKSDTQKADIQHDAHPDAERGRFPLLLSIGVMAAVGCVVGLMSRRRGFLGTANQPVRVPAVEPV